MIVCLNLEYLPPNKGSSDSKFYNKQLFVLIY